MRAATQDERFDHERDLRKHEPTPQELADELLREHQEKRRKALLENARRVERVATRIEHLVEFVAVALFIAGAAVWLAIWSGA
jgi:hypothetical protein